MKKSLTQMTKRELLDVINTKDQTIAELNTKIDELESMAIASAAMPLDAKTSRLLTSMNQRIKELEDKTRGQDQ